MMSEDLAKKKRGLGRGLSALFEDDEGVYPQTDPAGNVPGAQRKNIAVDCIMPDMRQPRRHFTDSAIDELAESLKRHGVLQPLLVRPISGDHEHFRLVAGERRWRAAQKAGLHEVPVVIRAMDDSEALQIALIENLQRADLNPVEEAMGYKQLIERYNHRQEDVAAMVSKSRSHIANMLRLLHLPKSIRDMVVEGSISSGHARALLTAKNPEALAEQIIREGLSVRDTERLAANTKTAGSLSSKSGSHKETKSVDTVALEREVSDKLGMEVKVILKGNKHSGDLKVRFTDLDQLDKLLYRLTA